MSPFLVGWLVQRSRRLVAAIEIEIHSILLSWAGGSRVVGKIRSELDGAAKAAAV